MDLTLSLTAAEAAKLLQKAQSEGKTPEHLIRQAIEDFLRLSADEVSRPSPSRELREADRALDELVASLPPMPSLSDHALSREMIYGPDEDMR